MYTIDCIIDSLIFESPDSPWAVMKASEANTDTSFVIVGDIANISPGASVLLKGNWIVDPKRGRQFEVDDWSEKQPASLKGIEKYLGSGIFKGIGPFFAKKITAHFGEKTLEIIDSSPERLKEIPALGKKRREALLKEWEKRRKSRKALVFLQGLGLSATKAANVVAAIPERLVESVKADPYCIVRLADGISFPEADKIALTLGYSLSDPKRVRAAALFMLEQALEKGNIFLERRSILALTASLLHTPEQEISDEIDRMASEKIVFCEYDAVYLPKMYYCEKGVARRLLAIRDTPPSTSAAKADAASRAQMAADELKTPGSVAPTDFDDTQLRAIETAVEEKVMVLTGGPGTGKTTVTKGIIGALKARGKRILLAAPTGRAAKRMTEATGMESRTIHRLLEYSPVDGFVRDADNPLKGDVLIVDECSMLDIMLFYSLLKAMPDSMQLIMVGDIDQLPSVGPGKVLRDIIESGVMPVARLTRIFRQAGKSRIVRNAHAINAGMFPDCSNGADADFFFISRSDPQEIASLIVGMVQTRLPRAYALAPADIQVLSPTQKGDIGTTALNRLIQGAVNPTGPSISYSGQTFRLRDKVMQTKNNYDKNIFNGDIGYISSVDIKKQKITVTFDDRRISYEQNEISELLPAYAITIHKSQGSEFPAVIIPMSTTHAHMLQRNLLYTAITRAKRLCIVVGEPDAIREAVSNLTIFSRNSNLCRRLAEDGASKTSE